MAASSSITSPPQLSDAEAKIATLAFSMRTKLPYELRDMIYASLLDKPAIRAINFPQLLRPCHRAATWLGSSCPCGQLTSSTPAILKKKVVGLNIAAEAVKWMYENSEDIEIGPPEQFAKFFEGDLFGVGVRATDCQLRKLTAVIRVPQDVGTTDMEEYFTVLLQSRRHANFKLDIRIVQPGGYIRDWMFFEALGKLLYGPIKRIQREKIGVIMVHENGYLSRSLVTLSSNNTGPRWIQRAGSRALYNGILI